MDYYSNNSTLDITFICTATDNRSVSKAIEAVEQLRKFNSTIDENRQANWNTRSLLTAHHIKYRVLCDKGYANEFPQKTPIKITSNNILIDFIRPDKIALSSFSAETSDNDIIAYTWNVCIPITPSANISFKNPSNIRDRLYTPDQLHKFLARHQDKGIGI